MAGREPDRASAHDDQTDRAWHATEKWGGAEHCLQLCGPCARHETKTIEGRKNGRIERIGTTTEVEDRGAADDAGVVRPDDDRHQRGPVVAVLPELRGDQHAQRILQRIDQEALGRSVAKAAVTVSGPRAA